MKGQEHIARLLAADLLGLQIFDPHQQQFRFHPGPVFTQVLPADEINRASPPLSPRQRQRIWQQLQRRLRQTCRAWDGQR